MRSTSPRTTIRPSSTISTAKNRSARSSLSFNGGTPLRYGENPHQSAVFYGDLERLFDKLHGKDISYNNMLDIDAAINLIEEFDEPTFVIMKHNNACGVATRPTLSGSVERRAGRRPGFGFRRRADL